MLGYVYLAAFEECGIILSQRLFRRYGRMTRIWLGLTMGLMMLMWLPSLFAFFMDFTAAAHWCALGTALIGAGVSMFVPGKWDGRVRSAHEPPLWLAAAVVVPVTILMAYMQHTHIILPDETGALMTGQSTYGDLNLHLGIATGLVNAPYPPEYTILPGTLLGYPFLMDALSGSLYLLGMELRLAFIIPGVLMTALVCWGFVMLAWEMVRDWRAVLLASALLFFNGGLGFIYAIDGAMADPTAWREVFTGFYKAPANLIDENIRWVNVLVDMMLPQRTLLAGWCTVIPAIWMLTRCIREKDRMLFIILGVWAGAMPMIHTHSFLALGILSAVVMLCMLIRIKRKGKNFYLTAAMMIPLGGFALVAVAMRRYLMFIPAIGCAAAIGWHLMRGKEEKWAPLTTNFLLYGCIAVMLALPQLLTWTFPQTVGGGSLSIRPNWVNWNGHGLIDEYFWFWIKNVGPVYLVMIPAVMIAGRGQKMFALGALGIYLIAEIFQFQPNPYDNNKLFYVAFIIMLPLAAKYLVTLYEKIREVPGRRLIAGVFLFVSLFSGVLSVVRECVSEYELYSADVVEATEFIETFSDDDTVVLTGTQHNNPVSSIGGLKIVCGTGSFLYYHGVDYAGQERDVRYMYEDPAGRQDLFEKYGVDFIYVSSHERANYKVDTATLNQLYPLVFDGGVAVYAVSEEAQTACKKIGRI